MQIPQGSAGGAKPGPTPAMQVVGFHVEGTTPSPGQISILNDSTVDNVASSPTLVIIPPSFQKACTGDVLEKDNNNPSGSGGGAPAANTAHMPSISEAAAAARMGSSLPKPIQGAERSEALHRGLVKVESTNSMTSDTSSLSTVSEQMSLGTAVRTDSGPASVLVSPKVHVKAPAHHAPAAASASTAAPGAGPGAGPSSSAAQKDTAAAAAAAQGAGKKELTRAERRAIQEAQRAAKAASKGGAPPPAPTSKPTSSGAAASASDAAKQQLKGPAAAEAAAAKAAKLPGPPQAQAQQSGFRSESTRSVDSMDASAAVAAAAAAASRPKKASGRVVSLASADLFTHLQQFKKTSVSTLVAHKEASSIHPAVLQLGLRYADGTIRGANARCVAMLHTFCQLINDYKTPEGKSLNRDLTSQLNTIINFLVECRPLSVSMGNAIKHIKLLISRIDPSTPEDEAKRELIHDISDFINVRIHVADQMIVKHAAGKVDDGDVILTFAYSHVVAAALLEAAAHKKFRVVVVDARPELEGKQMLQKMLAAGLACTYVHFNAISYSLREVTKVFLGAAAVMSNGTVMGRAGSAAVAMMAHALSKPVLICCESYKFHERVQLDSITHNELGDPDELASVEGRPDVKAVAGWQDQSCLGLLNLKFDAMPAEYVTMIVTEFGMIPPTSVPVILREYTLARQEV